MDERRELARRMREMAVNTGALNCLGCGYEHNCGVHGCAVLKRAADLLAPAVDITTPIPLEDLRDAAAERLYLVRCSVCGNLALVKAGNPVEAAARTLGVGGG